MWRAALLFLCFTTGLARADTVYVLNSGDASISVVDVTTFAEVRRIPLLREAHHIVLSPDGRDLVLGDSAANELIFLDPTTGEIRRRERISNPYHLEFSPNGRYLVVASLRRDQIDIYEAATLTLIHRIRQRDKPSHVAFSPDSRWVYVTLQGTRQVSAVDLSNGSVAWVQEVGPEPAGIIWNRGKLLIGLMGRQEFVTLDPATREVRTAFRVGRGAHTAFPAPDGRTLYATSRVDSRIAEVDAETYEVRRVFEIPGGPDCIAFDPEGRIYATLRWTGRILAFDPRTGESAQARVGRSPHGIFVVPQREGVAVDFAYAAPGAISGSRPMAQPVVGGGAIVRVAVPPTPVAAPAVATEVADRAPAPTPGTVSATPASATAPR
ncbi:PQQ-binding-like beta-propeller repeat protein [Roseococcus sp. XZZS9]|uniref:PQQ-binding-like beta-propeller repeat protein n=2 Tax=Roseococcus pinisoli TaxID=2835040 RepID=A0ABS5QEJ9_9PROT|nr:beta-propeller fold lactonase family protein [Roseococcus pinisoli]MBS7811721.1 PQQ-binding-like beta-propeller repeat protein [Roseococcus pinisoli]